MARGYQLRIVVDDDERDCFDGFSREDYDRVASMVREFYDTTLEPIETSLRGWNWGKAQIENADVRFYVKDKLAFEMPLAHIANSNIAGKTEVSMEFVHPEGQQPDTNTGAANGGTSAGKGQRGRGDQLVEMRLHVPGVADKDGASGDEGEEEESAAAAFHESIKRKADIGQVAGDGIIVFKEVLVLTPRGRYDVDMFPTFLRLRGKTYDYKVLYQSINRLFLLPKPDDVHVQFVVGLDPPIRQGQTRYPYLVLQFPRDEEMDAELNLDEETIQGKYEGKLKKRYEEPTFKIVTNVFKVLSGQKLTVPGSFASSTEQASVKCNVKATEGLLYPLDKALLWVSKQPIHVPYSDVHQVIFSRVGLGGAAGVTSSKTFDMRVNTRSGAEHTFASINREEHDRLNAHFAERKLRIKNEMNESELGVAAAAALLDEESDEEMEDADGGRRSKKAAARASAADGDDDEDEEEDDEDFEASSEDDGGSPSEASSDEGSEAGGASDDDDERPSKKKKK